MVEIRPASFADCDACGELCKVPELAEANGEFVPAAFLKFHVDEDGLFFVAVDDGRIIGFILGEQMKGGIAFVHFLSVDESVRGKGVGKLLMAAYEDACKKKGVDYVFFYAPAFNENTLEFYRKRGYTEGKSYICFAKEKL